MKKPADMKQYPMEQAVDAVIIGTGAGGSPLLWKLATAGRSVVALEAGQWFEDPVSDFPTDELESPIYWKDERISGGADPTSFGANNSGKGVGGSMIHWGAYAPRPSAENLKLQSTDGVAVDWPMSLEDLKPTYEWLESFLGVSGPAQYPWDAERKYPLPPLPLNSSAIYMSVGCEALGIRVAHAPIAAVSQAYTRPEYGTRNGCVNRGYCHQGCRNGAKATMDVTFLPAALKAGAEIRSDSYVHGVERDSSGAITAVVYTDANGREQRQRCRAVFLCAGGVESPRQLLHWGIGNSSDQVGRNFMAHISTQVWATMKSETRPYKGFPASLITEDFLRAKDRPYAGGYLLQSYGILPVAWAEQVAAGRNLVGQALTDYLMQYNNVAGIGMHGDTLPNPENRVTLSDEKDQHGLAKPLVTFSLGKNENTMSDHAEDRMRRILMAAGGTDLWSSKRTAHTAGTCRMGTSAADSVVDPYGRSWDVPNLWIADNSVFPTSLAVNPALTIMALSLRTADKYLAN
ncbi:GMC family oxidoreductase [Terriglobus aquaticus]|uniref:GMC family oxidoreductase n=1 Tax=Terriglobus aquaticus TaxID=940139 RepID=A0ABW9KLJ1_9BACT|nr:GMC family oxidoreductase [Terriglobus aquaticus]